MSICEYVLYAPQLAYFAAPSIIFTSWFSFFIFRLFLARHVTETTLHTMMHDEPLFCAAFV